MQIHTYPVFFKLIYRYGNIPITLLFLLYLVPSVINIDQNLLYLIPTILLLFFIYFINKRYLSLYKVVPYKIISDDKKLICSDFLFSIREVTIFYEDVTVLQGGIFDGNLNGLMKVYDGRNQVLIGFYPKIKDANKLQTQILSRVNQSVYQEVVNKISSRRKPQKK